MVIKQQKYKRQNQTHGDKTFSIQGQVFTQNLSFSTKSTFFWIYKIPDSVETSKSNFKSKFCWHGRQGPRASKKEFRSFQKTKSKFLKSPKIPEFVSKIPILGDAVVSFFSIQPMHHKYSPLLLLLFLLFSSPKWNANPPLH